MLVQKIKELFKSKEDRDFIKLAKEFYPVEKYINDICNKKFNYKLPVNLELIKDTFPDLYSKSVKDYNIEHSKQVEVFYKNFKVKYRHYVDTAIEKYKESLLVYSEVSKELDDLLAQSSCNNPFFTIKECVNDLNGVYLRHVDYTVIKNYCDKLSNGFYNELGIEFLPEFYVVKDLVDISKYDPYKSMTDVRLCCMIGRNASYPLYHWIFAVMYNGKKYYVTSEEFQDTKKYVRQS